MIIPWFTALCIGLGMAWLLAPALYHALDALRADALANPQYDAMLRIGGILLVLGFAATVIIVAEGVRQMCIYDLRPRQAGGQHATHPRLSEWLDFY